LLFPDIFPKPVVVEFDQRNGSSDGGAILLKAADRRYRLTERLAACLEDERQAGKIDHQLTELLRQRVYGIACGYPDANDADRLAKDPIHKLLLGRDPIEGSRDGQQCGPEASGEARHAPGAPALAPQRGNRARVHGNALCHQKTWSHPRRVVIQAEVVRETGSPRCSENPADTINRNAPTPSANRHQLFFFPVLVSDPEFWWL